MPIQLSISNAIKGDAPLGGAAPFFNQYSFEFDGSTDYIETTSTYSELDGATALTISFWAKSTSAVTSIPIHIGQSPNRQMYVVFFSTGRITFVKNENGDNTYLRADTGTPHDGNWNHIMICIDLSASTKGKIFFNGSDITYIQTLDTNAIQTSTGNFYINEANKDFTGNIDEVAIWSGTDLRNDVATIYNSGLPNDLNSNGLTAPTTWYRMGDAATWTGKTWDLIDQGSGGNDGFSDTLPFAAKTTDIPT